MDGDNRGVREELLRLREQAAAQVAALDSDLHGLFEASRSSNADDEHDPEGATIAFERAQLAAVRDAAIRHLADLDTAVHRLDAGSYGVCQRCSRRIPAERLAVRPTALTCVQCAEQA